MAIALAFGSLSLAILLLLLLRGSKALRGGQDKQDLRGQTVGSATRTGGPRAGSCTLCGSLLGPGERMKSDLFPGSGPRMMRIFGCPHCLGAGSRVCARSCPVCASELAPTDYAIARYFEKPGRRHVHVLGCTRCRKG